MWNNLFKVVKNANIILTLTKPLKIWLSYIEYHKICFTHLIIHANNLRSLPDLSSMVDHGSLLAEFKS